MKEQVSHPAHYNQGDVECIDAIRSALGREGYIAWLRGTIIKYQWRAIVRIMRLRITHVMRTSAAWRT
jgi:Protein of unknwon function (DUF3310)